MPDGTAQRAESIVDAGAPMSIQGGADVAGSEGTIEALRQSCAARGLELRVEQVIVSGMPVLANVWLARGLPGCALPGGSAIR